jgi:hypothetical protein
VALAAIQGLYQEFRALREAMESKLREVEDAESRRICLAGSKEMQG